MPRLTVRSTLPICLVAACVSERARAVQQLGSGGVTAWVKIVGTLAGVGSGDMLTYPACRLDFNGRQCNKKVQASGDESGLFFCGRCQQSCQPMYRYLLNLSLVDFTGQLEHVSVFGELGDTVMGMNADEAHEVRLLPCSVG